MTAVLHAATLLLAAVGVGALVGARPRRGGSEIVGVVLMSVAMADAMTLSLLPSVLWFGVLLLAGVLLASRIRTAGNSDGRSPTATTLTAHTALALVATAALILVMPSMSTEQLLPISAHAHGSITALPAAVSAIVGAGTIALTAVALRVPTNWPHRLHHSAMAASTLAMCMVVVV